MWRIIDRVIVRCNNRSSHCALPHGGDRRDKLKRVGCRVLKLQWDHDTFNLIHFDAQAVVRSGRQVSRRCDAVFNHVIVTRKTNDADERSLHVSERERGEWKRLHSSWAGRPGPAHSVEKRRNRKHTHLGQAGGDPSQEERETKKAVFLTKEREKERLSIKGFSIYGIALPFPKNILRLI